MQSVVGDELEPIIGDMQRNIDADVDAKRTTPGEGNEGAGVGGA